VNIRGRDIWEIIVFALWFVALAAPLGGVAGGCGAVPDTRQSARVEVEEGGRADVGQEAMREGAVKTDGARDVRTAVHSLDAERRQLEESRLREQRLMQTGMMLMFVGVLLIAALTPNWFPERLVPLVWVLALCLLAGGYALPHLAGLLMGVFT